MRILLNYTDHRTDHLVCNVHTLHHGGPPRGNFGYTALNRTAICISVNWITRIHSTHPRSVVDAQPQNCPRRPQIVGVLPGNSMRGLRLRSSATHVTFWDLQLGAGSVYLALRLRSASMSDCAHSQYIVLKFCGRQPRPISSFVVIPLS